MATERHRGCLSAGGLTWGMSDDNGGSFGGGEGPLDGEEGGGGGGGAAHLSLAMGEARSGGELKKGSRVELTAT